MVDGLLAQKVEVDFVVALDFRRKTLGSLSIRPRHPPMTFVLHNDVERS